MRRLPQAKVWWQASTADQASIHGYVTDSKLLLREHKADGVLDSEIYELCDEVITLLTSSLYFFEAIMKFPATDADVNDTEQKKERMMELNRKNDVLKGNITVKGYVTDAYSIWFMKICK